MIHYQTKDLFQLLSRPGTSRLPTRSGAVSHLLPTFLALGTTFLGNDGRVRRLLVPDLVAVAVNKLP